MIKIFLLIEDVLSAMRKIFLFFSNIIHIWNCIRYLKMNKKENVHFENCATTQRILWDKRHIFQININKC